MPALLRAGWALESAAAPEAPVSADELAGLRGELYRVDLAGAMDAYTETVFKVRDLGVAFSDRRAGKGLQILAASALLCERRACRPSDVWVLRYVWDREDQIEPLAALVNGVLQQHAGAAASHPLAAVQESHDAEELARQLDGIEGQINGTPLSLS